MRIRHKVPSIFNLSMVDVLCCALGCVILVWLVNLREAKENEDTSAQLATAASKDRDEAQARKAEADERTKKAQERAAEADEKAARTREEAAKAVAAARKERDDADARAAAADERTKKAEEKAAEADKRAAKTTEDAAKAVAAARKERADAQGRAALADEKVKEAEEKAAAAGQQSAKTKEEAEKAVAAARKERDDARGLLARADDKVKKADEKAAESEKEVAKSKEEAEKALAAARKERDDARREKDELGKRVLLLQGQVIENEKRFAGMPLTGENVVFLVDTSGSMKYVGPKAPDPQKWPGVCGTVAQLMRSLPNLKKFQVITFADEPKYLFKGTEGRWIDYDPRKSADEVLAALLKIDPDDGTNLYASMQWAFRFRAQGLDTVYLFSDGLPNMGEGVPEATARQMRQNDKELELGRLLGDYLLKTLRTDWNAPREAQGQKKVRINTVGFFYESPDCGAFLWALARSNDGNFVGMSKP
jgi:chemotaxis protein histidine kinase CheA